MKRESTRWHCCVLDFISPPSLYLFFLSSLFWISVSISRCLFLSNLQFPLSIFYPSQSLLLSLSPLLSVRSMYDGASYTAGNWTHWSVVFPETKLGAWGTQKAFPKTVCVCLIDCHTRTHTYSCSQICLCIIRIMLRWPISFVEKRWKTKHDEHINNTNQGRASISATMRRLKMEAGVWASRQYMVKVKRRWVISAEVGHEGWWLTDARINAFLEVSLRERRW